MLRDGEHSLLRADFFKYELVTLNSCAAEQRLSLVPGEEEKFSCLILFVQEQKMSLCIDML